MNSTRYHPLLACDIASSAGRGATGLQNIREALRSALSAAFAAAGLTLADCPFLDTGDGFSVVTPADLPKAGLLHPLLPELAQRIHEHNRQAQPGTQLAVRVALHAGEIHVAADGSVSGPPFEVLARLLDADQLRRAVREVTSGAPVAAILSQHFYEETVGHGYEGLDPDAFTRASVAVKAYSGEAWLWYPGSPIGPRLDSSSAGALSPTSEPSAPESAGPEQSNQASGRSMLFAVNAGDMHVRQTGRD